MTDTFTPVGHTGAFPDGSGKRVVVGGRHVAVFRLGDELHALDNMCLHRGGPLCDGDVRGGVVTCPWHGWSFDIRSGTMVQDPRTGVSRHDVKVENGQVSVRLTD